MRVPAEWAAVGVTVGGVCAERHHSDELLHTPGDLTVAAHATRQHGTVATAQLVAAGLGRGAIHLRVRQGRLHPIHRGVYAVGHPRLTTRGHMWAAVLAAEARTPRC